MGNYGYHNIHGQQPPQYGFGSAIAAENESALNSYVSRIMRRVFGKMFLAILVTALTSLFVASNAEMVSLLFTNRISFFLLIGAEVALVLYLSARINKMKASTARVLFYVYAVASGLTLTPILLIYSGEAIVKTFFITAAVFGTMAVYGYVTKANLAKMGSVLVMCLIGLIVASVINIFLANSRLDWIISLAGVAIFVGLTAWDTQKIKRMAEETVGNENVSKVATLGALSLYLDFINLFIYLLRFFGGSRN